MDCIVHGVAKSQKCLSNFHWASLIALSVKNLPAMQETWVWFLGWEDPLEKEMATHSSILAWRIPWTEEPGRLVCGVQRVGHDLVTKLLLLLDEGERGEWKNWLKTQHSKNKDYGIHSPHSWPTDGETMETVTDFISLGSKITSDGDCSHEVKRHLLLGRKAMTNLDSVLKSRDITWLTKVI